MVVRWLIAAILHSGEGMIVYDFPIQNYGANRLFLTIMPICHITLTSSLLQLCYQCPNPNESS